MPLMCLKGIIFIPNIPALSRNKTYFDKPDSFEPCRFLADGSKLLKEKQQLGPSQRDQYQYGFGRRLCPDMHIAESSLHIAIARVLWAFDITPIQELTRIMENQRSILSVSVRIDNC